MTARTALGDIPTTTVLSGFKEFDGMVLPTKHVQRLMGMETHLTIESVRTNLKELPSFGPPPAVQQIMKERAK
jgi:hypothetical protein